MRRCFLVSFRHVPTAIVLGVLFFMWNNAKSPEHPTAHSVYPLANFSRGQWVEKVPWFLHQIR